MIENKIEMLSDKAHIIKRPGMYIGSVAMEEHERFLFGEYQKVKYVPGLIKLVDEIIDNSTDEAIRTDFKFANKIEVTANQFYVTVSDNGRGIPQDIVITPEGEELPGPVAAWTRTKAGGNFGDDADRKTGGQNGVGSALTNIFSDRFIGTTCDGKNKLIVQCENGSDKVDWNITRSKNNGTEVTFHPDFSHFETESISSTDLDIILYRLQTLAVVYPKIQFKFNKQVVSGSFKDFCKQFDESSIVIDNNTCSIGIGRSPDGFRQLSYVNNINTVNGGTHLEYVLDEISNILIPSIKRKYAIEITKSRIKECLTFIMMVRDMSNLRFDSQTKERLTSPYGEIKNHIDIDCKKIAKCIMASEDILTPIIEAALARKLAAEKAAATKAEKAAAKTNVTKHIKAKNYGKKGMGTSIFLAEGDSAIGYLCITRNKELHGGFPLRGKVLNTWGMSPADQVKNKEIFNILAITGLYYGAKDSSCLNYDYINIFCDNDHDGRGSIFPTLLGFFSQWPWMFEEGRIRWVKTPIVIASIDEDNYNDAKWYYSLEEYDADKKNLTKYKNIRYIKGLGSLQTDEYSKVVNEPKLDVVTLPPDWKDLFEMLLGDDAQKRKTWMSSLS